MSAIFGIAGTWSDNDIVKMQNALKRRGGGHLLIQRYENGFLGCFTDNDLNSGKVTEQTCSVTDGYMVFPAETDGVYPGVDTAGLYAHAVFNHLTGTLQLFRDPSGARPLYYAVDSNRCIFASRPKAILAVTVLGRHLNPSGIALYLSMICPPDPITVFQSIEMLRPGFCLTWNEITPSVRRFWSPPPNASDAPFDSESVASSLRRALENAVSDAIPDDCEGTGFFLSGGTDTGAVVALAAKAGKSPINTFTIGYEGTGSGYDDYNEFYYARLIADRYQTVHHEYTVSPNDVIAALPGIIAHLDQPSGDAINSFLVAGSLPAHIHTVLTGTGGDEIFIGSHWFRQQARLQHLHERWMRVPGIIRRFLLAILKKSHTSSARRIQRLAALGAGAPAHYRHFKLLFDPESILSPDYLSHVRGGETADQIIDMYDTMHKDSDDVNRMVSLLFHHEVSNLQLRDLDSMCHAHHIEARSPLVDRRVLDVLHPLPATIKAPDGRLRHLMFQALDDCLLMETRTRRKMSFIVPMDLWARRELRPVIETLLCRESILKRGVLNPAMVQKELDSFFRTGSERHPFKIWNLALLELWCRFHVDAPVDASPPESLEDLL